jgi:hypothetical protein
MDPFAHGFDFDQRRGRRLLRRGVSGAELVDLILFPV